MTNYNELAEQYLSASASASREGDYNLAEQYREKAIEAIRAAREAGSR
jgi:hypothetical protein